MRGCGGRIDGAESVARRDAGRVRPPGGALFGGRRTRAGIGVLCGKAVAAGMLADAVAAVSRSVGDHHRAPQVEAARRRPRALRLGRPSRSEETTSELQSPMRTSYAAFCSIIN